MKMFEDNKFRIQTIQSQYKKIVDLLILHIYLPLNKLDAALSLLKKSSLIENKLMYENAIRIKMEKNAQDLFVHSADSDLRLKPLLTISNTTQSSNKGEVEIEGNLNSNHSSRQIGSKLHALILPLLTMWKKHKFSILTSFFLLFLVIYKRSDLIRFLSSFLSDGKNESAVTTAKTQRRINLMK